MSENAVIVRFDYGSTDLDPLFELEEALEDAIEAAKVGEFDGNEIAESGSDGLFYMYGPDADALFAVIRPILADATCIRNAVATLRYGAPDEDARQVETKI